jgi:hypothetical protein
MNIKRFYDFGVRSLLDDDTDDPYERSRRFYDFGSKKRFYDFGSKKKRAIE